MAVSIPGAFIADPLRARRADRYFQFLLNDELDSAPNSLPHQLFQRAFPLPFAPAIPLHSVILRYPPASGCELWFNSPDLDAFFTFPPTSRVRWEEADEDIRVEIPNDQGRSGPGRNRVLRASRQRGV